MSKMLAHGAVLWLGDGGSPTEEFDSVPYFGSINFVIPDAELVDVTSHTESYREELAGLQELIEIDVPLIYDVAEPTHVAIRDLAISAQPANWKIVTASGSTIDFSARVRSRELALGIINQAEQLKIKLRLGYNALVITDGT